LQRTARTKTEQELSKPSTPASLNRMNPQRHRKMCHGKNLLTSTPTMTPSQRPCQDRSARLRCKTHPLPLPYRPLPYRRMVMMKAGRTMAMGDALSMELVEAASAAAKAAADAYERREVNRTALVLLWAQWGPTMTDFSSVRRTTGVNHVNLVQPYV